LPRVHFHQQLEQLKDKLLAMAALSQQALEASVDAYLERNVALCEYVGENETAINTAHREVDEMSYELLAQEQPMAVDLRFILAVIKINGNLERIGDQSMSIAQRTLEMASREPLEIPVDIAKMRDIARAMIRGALQALLDGDAKLAASVVDMDDEIDRLNRETHERLISVIASDAAKAEQSLHSIIISRNLERIADHAVNIASDVVFWIDGTDIRHSKTVGCEPTSGEAS
jgi:phosphate transport system protein